MTRIVALGHPGAWILLAGLAVQVGASFAGPHVPAIVAKLLGFLAGGLQVYGGTQVARAKGYIPWLGFLAMFTYLGAGFVLLFPEAPERKRLFKYIRSRETAHAPA